MGTMTNGRAMLLVVVVLAAIAMVAAALVVKARSSSSLDLSGNWVARQGVVTVDLSLRGSGNTLRGDLTTKNAPLPIRGTVQAVVSGSTARVTLRALGQIVSAHCDVSSSKMICTGTGGTQTLTLTFTRS